MREKTITWLRSRLHYGLAHKSNALRLLKRVKRNRDGAAAIEFAFLATPFFFIVFALLETAMVFVADITLEQAVAKAGRNVRTGQVATSNLSEADFRQMLCNEINLLLSCDEIMIDLRSYPSFSAIPTQAPINGGALNTSDFRYEQGKAGEIMALRAFYEWPLFTDIMHSVLSDIDGGKHLVASTAVFQAEPF